MNSLHEFLTMGGYAGYVWPAYAVAAVVMIANAVMPLGRLKRIKADIRVRKGGP
ncbi:MAG TPA: heme exporter protein CcmD [Gammaproteobacteria bacterium]|jgi:heme exporter protein D